MPAMAGNGSKRGAGKTRRSSGQRGTRSTSGNVRPDLLGLDQLIRAALRDIDDLLGMDDPLQAEEWASSVLGAFYRLRARPDVVAALEQSLQPALVQGAERRGSAAGLAAVCALGAVSDAPCGAEEAATRLVARGLTPPPWAAAVGRPDPVACYVAAATGEETPHYFVFRYAEHVPHVLVALHDAGHGGFVRDAFVATLRADADPRALIAADTGNALRDADPATAAVHIRAALATGDGLRYDWPDDFRRTRALLLARLRLLTPATD